MAIDALHVSDNQVAFFFNFLFIYSPRQPLSEHISLYTLRYMGILFKNGSHPRPYGNLKLFGVYIPLVLEKGLGI